MFFFQAENNKNNDNAFLKSLTINRFFVKMYKKLTILFYYMFILWHISLWNTFFIERQSMQCRAYFILVCRNLTKSRSKTEISYVYCTVHGAGWLLKGPIYAMQSLFYPSLPESDQIQIQNWNIICLLHCSWGWMIVKGSHLCNAEHILS